MGIADKKKILNGFFEGVEQAKVRRADIDIPIVHLRQRGGFCDFINDMDRLVLRCHGWERTYPIFGVKSITEIDSRTLRIHADLDWIIETELWTGDTEALDRAIGELQHPWSPLSSRDLARSLSTHQR